MLRVSDTQLQPALSSQCEEEDAGLNGNFFNGLWVQKLFSNHLPGF